MCQSSLGTAVVTALATLAGLTLSAAGQEAPVINLWPAKPPGDVGVASEEKFFELQVGGKPYQVGGKPTKWLTNVSRPAITVYRPPQDKDTGVAMLICPGGGYHNLGWDVEGEEVAAWLNRLGMTGIILKYRCPRREGDVRGVPPPGPLKDAQRAVSLVRSKAKEWGIDPRKIGMVGFSAGGHLVGATATAFEKRAYEPIDGVDEISCRPDFAVMLYSGYFNPKIDAEAAKKRSAAKQASAKESKAKDNGAKENSAKQGEPDRELSPTIRVTADAPPMFLVHATDDTISNVEHSVTMYLAMKRAGVPVELHVYATGGHGFGVRKVSHPCEGWTERCTDWLRHQGFLKATTGQ